MLLIFTVAFLILLHSYFIFYKMLHYQTRSFDELKILNFKNFWANYLNYYVFINRWLFLSQLIT